MRLAALISGGKDSCYGLLQCVAAGHDIVALAHLRPKDDDELDSYMYQCAGHNAVELYAEALELPLYQALITGRNVCNKNDYVETAGDEVEDLYKLLETIKVKENIEGVCGGAILSNYQRVRVEDVCGRLNLVSFAYLWRRDQTKLLSEMIACRLQAIIVKVAALGLTPQRHLGRDISEVFPHLIQMNQKYGLNVCGEGGEYETFTLDCPLFKKKIVIDEQDIITHSNDAFAPVAFLKLKKTHLESKPGLEGLTPHERVLEVGTCNPDNFLMDLNLNFRSQNDLADGIPVVASIPVLQSVITLAPSLTFSPSGWFWVSNLIATASEDPGTEMNNAMNCLKNILSKKNLSLSHLVSVQLYIRDMKTFDVINKSYKSFFNLNPPSRVCVEVPLPSNCSFILNCNGFKNTNEDEPGYKPVYHMHVQSVSHWAPANIGPYSQAVQVGNIIYIAGQIGLVPGTMQMVDGGIRTQCRLSLRHVRRVLKAMDDTLTLRHALFGVCYVTHHSYITIALDEWVMACDGKAVPQIFAVVPGLPKNSLVEWQVIAHTGDNNWIWKKLDNVLLDQVSTQCNLGLLEPAGSLVSLVAECSTDCISNVQEETFKNIICYLTSIISDYNIKSSIHFQVYVAHNGSLWNVVQNAMSKLDHVHFSLSLVPVLSFHSSTSFIYFCSHFY